jgi:hypothetical protein
MARAQSSSSAAKGMSLSFCLDHVQKLTAGRIHSLFVLSLPATSGELKLEQVVSLTGSPLHLATLSNDKGSLQRVLVAIDAGEDTNPTNARVVALDFTTGGLTVDESFELQAGSEEDEPDLPAEDVRRLLRGVEDLRKHRSEYQDGDAEEAQDEA